MVIILGTPIHPCCTFPFWSQTIWSLLNSKLVATQSKLWSSFVCVDKVKILLMYRSKTPVYKSLQKVRNLTQICLSKQASHYLYIQEPRGCSRSLSKNNKHVSFVRCCSKPGQRKKKSNFWVGNSYKKNFLKQENFSTPNTLLFLSLQSKIWRNILLLYQTNFIQKYWQSSNQLHIV